MTSFNNDNPGMGVANSIFGAVGGAVSPVGAVKSVGAGAAIGAGVGLLTGGVAGMAGGAAIGAVTGALEALAHKGQQLIGVGDQLAKVSQGITENFKHFSSSMALASARFKELERNINYAWAKALEPMMKRWNEWSLEFKKNWEELKIKFFVALRPILEWLLAKLQALAGWFLKLATSCVDLIKYFANLGSIVKAIMQDLPALFKNLPRILIEAFKSVYSGMGASSALMNLLKSSFGTTSALLDKIAKNTDKNKIDMSHTWNPGLPTGWGLNARIANPTGGSINKPPPSGTSHAAGGEVPGNYPGQPVQITAHAGEEVIPSLATPEQYRAATAHSMLGGFRRFSAANMIPNMKFNQNIIGSSVAPGDDDVTRTDNFANMSGMHARSAGFLPWNKTNIQTMNSRFSQIDEDMWSAMTGFGSDAMDVMAAPAIAKTLGRGALKLGAKGIAEITGKTAARRAGRKGLGLGAEYLGKRTVPELAKTAGNLENWTFKNTTWQSMKKAFGIGGEEAAAKAIYRPSLFKNVGANAAALPGRLARFAKKHPIIAGAGLLYMGNKIMNRNLPADPTSTSYDYAQESTSNSASRKVHDNTGGKAGIGRGLGDKAGISREPGRKAGIDRGIHDGIKYNVLKQQEQKKNRGGGEGERADVGAGTQIVIQVRDSDDIITVFNEAWLRMRSKLKEHEAATALECLQARTMMTY